MERVREVICDLPEVALNRIFGNSQSEAEQPIWACKAIFQSLTPLSKLYIMRILLIEDAIPMEMVNSWIRRDSRQKHGESLTELRRLRLITVHDITASQTQDVEESIPYITINPYFCTSLRRSLCHANRPWDSEDMTTEETNQPSFDEIDQYSIRKWDNVLRFLVGIPPLEGPVRKAKKAKASDMGAVESFFRMHGYMDDDRGKKSLGITSKGYEFMLKDRNSQVCEFVFDTITMLTEEQKHLALSLLFTLSYCEVGKGYPMDVLSHIQVELIESFSAMGLVYFHECAKLEAHTTTMQLFYPTRMAVGMLFKDDLYREQAVGATNSAEEPFLSSSKRSESHGSLSMNFTVIVETNMQVIAYATNELHIAMLEKFVDLKLRMPNMAMGFITRDRSKEAFQRGLKASQIIHFLESHAHPLVQYRRPIVPENVTDQLCLWEKENRRMMMVRDAVVVNLGEIPEMSGKHFRSIVKYLKRLDLCQWEDEKQLLVAVTEAGLEQLESFVEEDLGLRL